MDQAKKQLTPKEREDIISTLKVKGSILKREWGHRDINVLRVGTQITVHTLDVAHVLTMIDMIDKL